MAHNRNTVLHIVSCMTSREHWLARTIMSSVTVTSHQLNLHKTCWKTRFTCVGTQANRKEFPRELKSGSPLLKALHRGETLFRHKGNLVANVWEDRKPVCFLAHKLMSVVMIW